MRKLTVRKLERPEHSGDWHDKPLRWIAECANNPLFTQKFSTKKDAMLWVGVARSVLDYKTAFGEWMRKSV